ncbi:MAG: transporter permease [Solirubrobacterales bacterium]|nr:transporter permease [Solirubrobacterales bacterium]
MRRVALRGLLARKTRLALTALAVALGVMLIAGTYVFTDTINSSFDRIFSVSLQKIDVVITPDTDLSGDDGTTVPLDASLLRKARAVDGVRTAEGSVSDQNGTVLGKDGKPVSQQGAPMIIASLNGPAFESLNVADGRFPKTADEVALDKGTADKEGFKLGARISVQGVAPRKRYRLVGLTTIGGVPSLGGAAFATLTLAEAQRMTGKQGRFDAIDIDGDPGVDPRQLTARVRQISGRGTVVRTGRQEAQSQSDDIRSNLSFLSTALLAFGGISLFVGAFIIFNTFSITVAQRAREFALLRTLGASRRQVLRSVLLEGLAIGVLGAAAGLGLGIAVASGLRALFKSFGIDLPSSGTVILTRTITVSLIVGILVTLIACVVPALRATRVPPVAALREGVALPETRHSRLAFPLALVLTAIGVALLVLGLFVASGATSALSLTGAGAAVTFLGVALLSPRLVPPIASLVGAPLQRLFGLTGRLARENSVRQPGRTATTAAALMVGVALVCFAAIFAAGANKTIADAVDSGLRGQVILQNQAGFGAFTPAAGAAVKQIPGVEVVSPVRGATTRVQGISGKEALAGIDPAGFQRVYRLTVVKPRTPGRNAIRDLPDNGLLVETGYADDHKLKLGDPVALKTPRNGLLRVKVSGIFKDKGQLVGSLVVSNRVLQQQFGVDRDQLTFIGLTGGRENPAVKRAIDARLARDFPQVEARTAAQFTQDQRDQINQLLGLIYALLALTVIVALFGIVNTLVLSITERTRELGMLRAVGTSRRQVKAMIRLEAVITAMIGGVLGIVLGVGLSLLVTRAIDDFSIAFPVGTLVVVLIASGVAGVLAAILPARRAARLDVLEALAYE